MATISNYVSICYALAHPAIHSSIWFCCQEVEQTNSAVLIASSVRKIKSENVQFGRTMNMEMVH